MRAPSKKTERASKKRVRALFEDVAVLFDVDDDATLEQLAALLAAAGRGHGAALVIEVFALEV